MSNPWAALLRQPVLIALGAAALALFGLAAVLSLPIRSSPIIPYRLIDISTNFPGADPATIDRFVTLPLQSALAGQPGIRYVTGTSISGNSDINAVLADGAAPDTVFAEVLAAVNAARGNLPPAIQQPNISLVGDENANQELNINVMFPPSLSLADVTAYATANIVPRLETVPGIGPVMLYSGNPSLRVHMDPLRLQALGIAPGDVAQRLTQASEVDPIGTLRDGVAATQVNRGSDLENPTGFDGLPVTTRDGVTIPLRSIAATSLGFNPGSDVAFWDRQPTVYIAAGIAPAGNILDVARHVRATVAAMQPMLPPGVQLLITYDESTSVSESLRDLAFTLVITILLVGVIIRLSLGTMRAALAPFLALLLSLLGAAVVMQVTGQTLNLFTIIALVLAVGLVVDDAIVVVEDVFRRVQEGLTPMEAASASVTRLAPVLAAISSTLVVAFLPLGFLSGLTAALFRPFALVLISAFLLSLLIALTVVPYMAMWASRTYRHSSRRSLIDTLRDLYVRLLTPALRVTPLIAVGVAIVAFGCLVLLRQAPRNLLPAADGLGVNVIAGVPNGASINYVLDQIAQMETVMHKTYPDMPDWMVGSEQSSQIFGGYTFDTPEQAKRATLTLARSLGTIHGISPYVFQDSGMPGAEDLPVSVNLSGQAGVAKLYAMATKVQNAARASGDFNYLNANPGQPLYQVELRINRPLAARLGVTDEATANALSAALSGGTLGQVSIGGNSLDVVTEMPAEDGTAMLQALPVKTGNGALIPLGTVISLVGREQAAALGSWQGLPSVTIQAQPAAGVSMSQALRVLQNEFAALGARDASFGYSGPSEIFQDSERQNSKLFGLGLMGLFFLLAAQFRSLRDPFVVITTVPLASLGPLVLFVAGGATLNIVTEIALLTVWGLIARQGILFVQIAHEGRALDLPVRMAALRAARLRFRPILMITLALLGGAAPLILASGPQAVIRYDLGVVLATGMGSGFLLSLFAVPAMYCLLHRGRDA